MDRRGSGGAEALLAKRVASRSPGATAGSGASDSPFGAIIGAVGGMFEVPLERLRPDPGQPRKDCDERQLDELAANMKVVGQIEPAIVRPDPDRPGHYIIVVGERRWRAAAKAGFPGLQCILRAEDVRLVPAKQWSENHFRAELSPIEEAGGLKAIMEIEGLDVARAAERYGISERTIRRHLQLLDAPVWIQAAVARGDQVGLGDGTTELRKLDLTGGVELLRIYNSYLRHEQEPARSCGEASGDRPGHGPEEAVQARALRKAEAVKERALRENWSRRKWQDFAAAVGKQVPEKRRCATAPASLFQVSENRVVVRVQHIRESCAADLARLAEVLSELLEQVQHQARAARDAQTQIGGD